MVVVLYQPNDLDAPVHLDRRHRVDLLAEHCLHVRLKHRRVRGEPALLARPVEREQRFCVGIAEVTSFQRNGRTERFVNGRTSRLNGAACFSVKGDNARQGVQLALPLENN